MLLIAGIGMALLAALLFNASMPLRHMYENAISIPLLMMAQIVLISQALSILEQMTTGGYLIAQGLMLLISVAVWWWRGHPALSAVWPIRLSRVWQAMKAHPFLVVMGGVILSMIAYYAISGAIAQNYFVDAERYHIPRALLWLQYETADHFFTQNFRLTEFPPNASFIYAWMVALSGQTAGLNIPQAVAACVGSLVTFGLARAAGFRRGQSTFAALLLLFNFELLNQIQEAQIDLIIMALTGAFLLFAVRIIQLYPQKEQRSQTAYLLYLAIAFGLAIGTKLTVFFMLPGAAFACLVYALYHSGRAALPVLMACATAAICGAVVFGSYNYVLNTLAYENPIGSQSRANSSDIVNRGSLDDIDTLLDPAANLVRYGYQFIGLEAYHVLLPIRQADITQPKNRLFERVFGEDGLQIAYHIGDAELSTYHAPSTHLLIFSVAIFLSPFALLYMLARIRQSERYRLSALYLTCALSWLLLLAVITAWSPWKMRLVLILLPLLAAALFPWLYTSRRRGLLWLVPLLLIASANFGIMRDSPLRGDRTTTTAAQNRYMDTLQPLIPADSRVGLVGEQLAPFLAMRAVPSASYTYIPADDITRQLEQNQVDIVLTTGRHCQATPSNRVRVRPLMPRHISCIYTTSAAAEAASGMIQLTEADQPMLQIEPGIHLAMQTRGVDFHIPNAFIESLDGDVQITLHLAEPVDAQYINRIHCEGAVLPHRISPQAIEVTWPRSEIPADGDAMHFCQVLAFNYSLPVSRVTVRGSQTPEE